MNGPLVTVVTPCFNDGAYLRETLDCLFKQKYPNIEIIVVDDGSSDPATVSALEELQRDYDSVKFFRKENGGPSSARNYGIQRSSGKYILPLDADDLIADEYIAKCVQVLEKHPEVGIVYCKAEFFGEKSGTWDLPDFCVSRFAWDNVIFNAAMFRKSDWRAVGGYDDSLIHGSEDYDFWLSLVEKDLIPFRLPEVLFYYRIKPESRSKKFANVDFEHKVETYAKIFNNHRNFFDRHMKYFYRTKFALEQRVSLSKKSVFWDRNVVKSERGEE